MVAMPDEEHFRKLERMYAGSPCSRSYGSSVKVARGEAEVRFPVRPELFHSGGALHGSAYFKALDDAAFFAANSMVTGNLVLTTSFQIYLLRPVTSGEIRAVGRLLHKGRQLLVAESVAFDERGKTVARGSGTFTPSGPALDADIGYR